MSVESVESAVRSLSMSPRSERLLTVHTIGLKTINSEGNGRSDTKAADTQMFWDVERR